MVNTSLNAPEAPKAPNARMPSMNGQNSFVKSVIPVFILHAK